MDTRRRGGGLHPASHTHTPGETKSLVRDVRTRALACVPLRQVPMRTPESEEGYDGGLELEGSDFGGFLDKTYGVSTVVVGIFDRAIQGPFISTSASLLTVVLESKHVLITAGEPGVEPSRKSVALYGNLEQDIREILIPAFDFCDPVLWLLPGEGRVRGCAEADLQSPSPRSPPSLLYPCRGAQDPRTPLWGPPHNLLPHSPRGQGGYGGDTQAHPGVSRVISHEKEAAAVVKDCQENGAACRGKVGYRRWQKL
ncbi:hypothetical protein BDK51DRAFT_41237 [Blyttiomyces helicus]|uniref:Uncharacterized protein n=1 Tax=Blyttiomyces helicus TaxID=388810 RepID=A0A4V1IPY4_9FUNG|nr:hypothetical protein BDK51DRAFT_41237 [Blyttiomyces helicus]|eukprot:RKO84667.1 hypothetical protein BDK51DRAFT_41237 [Blyttiomyces helicus]